MLLLKSPDQRGVALPTAIVALVIIGALIGANFLTGRLEHQSGRNIMFAAQAREVAEAGIADGLAGADPARLETLALGDSPLDLGPLALSSGLVATRTISRLTSSLFLLRSIGVRVGPAGDPLATRSIGLIVRVLPVVPDSVGAPQTRLVPIAERAWVQLY
jgi:hypothetical protein